MRAARKLVSRALQGGTRPVAACNGAACADASELHAALTASGAQLQQQRQASLPAAQQDRVETDPSESQQQGGPAAAAADLPGDSPAPSPRQHQQQAVQAAGTQPHQPWRKPWQGRPRYPQQGQQQGQGQYQQGRGQQQGQQQYQQGQQGQGQPRQQWQARPGAPREGQQQGQLPQQHKWQERQHAPHGNGQPNSRTQQWQAMQAGVRDSGQERLPQRQWQPRAQEGQHAGRPWQPRGQEGQQAGRPWQPRGQQGQQAVRPWQPRGQEGQAGRPWQPRGAPAGGPAPQPFQKLEGRWWKHKTVKVQDGRPDKLVPVLLHHTDSCEEVLDLVRRNEESLTSRELTVACKRMGQLITQAMVEPRKPVPPENAWEHCAALFRLAQPCLPALDCQGLATLIWMCSRFHYLPPPEERKAWEEAVWERRGEVNLIETSNIFFSLGVLHWAPSSMGSLLEDLLDRALAGRGGAELTPWVVCNIMWGCARLLNSNFHPGPERLTQLMEACLPQLDSFTPESFCAMLFSLACLRVRPDDDAIKAILEAFESHVSTCSNRQLVTIVWSMGALQIGQLLTDRLWGLIEVAVQKQAPDFNFSSAPLFLFGSARMGLAPSESVIKLLLDKAAEHSNELRTGDVAVILWALSRLNFRVNDDTGAGHLVTEPFVQSMVDRFRVHNVEQPATLRHISALLWSTTSLKFHLDASTVSALIANADRLASAAGVPLSTTDANMLLSAFETLGSAEGLRLLKRHIMGRAGEDGSSSTDEEEESASMHSSSSGGSGTGSGGSSGSGSGSSGKKKADMGSALDDAMGPELRPQM